VREQENQVGQSAWIGYSFPRQEQTTQPPAVAPYHRLEQTLLAPIETK
jgi:hypothetical protein